MSTTLVARDDDGEVQVQQFKQQCLDYLDTILEHIGGFGEGVNILNDEHLATLNVRKAQPLDIDEGSVDFGPRFFAPRFTLAEAQQKTDAFLADHGEDMGNDGWPKRCRRGSYTSFLDDPDITYDPEDFHPLCDPHTQAAFRLAWFLNAIGADWYSEYSDSSNNGVWEDSDWDYVDGADLVPGRMFDLPQHYPCYTRVGSPQRAYAFHVSNAFLLRDSSTDKPHIAGTVVDSSEQSEGDVLRSEVAAAVGLLKHQFRRGDFCRHHTLPALVFSFQHERSGRVSQFHLDGRSLVLRQSRLLDFRSDEPTTDAYHMIRWMDNRPMGETMFSALATEEQKPGLYDERDTNSGKLPIDVRGA